MTKTFIIDELDCANCAAKIERKIGKIKGVENASVNFMTKKVFIDAAEADFDRIIGEASEIVAKVEDGASLKAL